MLCGLSWPVAEANVGAVKCFVRVSVKVSTLDGPGCWLSTTTKEVGCPLGCCCPLVVTWICGAGWMTWLFGISVFGMAKMYSLSLWC